jgi:hypothetical protein
MRITLIRTLEEKVPNDEMAVTGILILHSKKKTYILKTLENLLHLCPEGTFKLKNEYSPKFQRSLWELYGTNKRNEIKFHEGSRSLHSIGCILLGSDGLDILHDTLNPREVYSIKIINL